MKDFFLDFKMADLKELRFSKPRILNNFLQNFFGLVFELVQLFDVKGIDVAQPIWS